jgi:hypothetical protein
MSSAIMLGGAKRPFGHARASASLTMKVVTILVPSLIELQVFERVQRQLHARSPRLVANDWIDPADGFGGVCQLPGRDDSASRHVPERRHSSLLHRLDMRQQGQERV